MKEQTKFILGEPTSGARTTMYIGIAALFAKEWFDKSGHYATKRTYDSRLKPLRGEFETKQEKLKSQFFEALNQRGYSDHECMKKWEHIISECTTIATAHFKQLQNGQPQPYALDEASSLRAISSGEMAFLRLSELANDAMNSHPPQLDMLVNVRNVYLRRYEDPKDGWIEIKLGSTSNSKGRNGTYANTTGGNLRLVWETKENFALTEDSFRDALIASIGAGVNRKTGRDWFCVTNEVYERIDSPIKASRFIASTKKINP